MSVHIDPRAAVSGKADLGNDVTVGPFAVIEDDVVIGSGTSVGPNVVISNGARIGSGCRIFSGAAVAGPPQDLKYQGEKTLLQVGNNAVIREFVTLNRATIESGVTRIGNDCLFMAYSHVAHDCQLGNNVILANCVALGGHVHLGDWVIVGGLTPIHQFVHVGEHSMVGGGFRVTKDIPPYVLAGQEPLCFERINLLGLRRRGFGPKAIESIEQAYRVLYRSNLNVSQAIERIRSDVEQTPEIQAMIEFITSSKRGIIPGAGR